MTPRTNLTLRREFSHFPSSKSIAILSLFKERSRVSQKPVSQHVPYISVPSGTLREPHPIHYSFSRLFVSIACPFYWINFQSSQLCSNIFHSRQHNPKQKSSIPSLSSYYPLSPGSTQSNFIKKGPFGLSSSSPTI